MDSCPVPAAGTDTNRILVVVPNPAARGRFVARPVSPGGELRSGMFDGNFIHSGDQRFSEAFNGHPIPVHDRFEDRRRTPLTGDHDISRRVDRALRPLSTSDRLVLLADVLAANLDLESDPQVAEYYWGRNRGGRHVSPGDLGCHPTSDRPAANLPRRTVLAHEGGVISPPARTPR